MLMAAKRRFIDSVYTLLPNSIEENYQQVESERLLWNNKPIRENSVLLWDLENIAFHRLDEIKRVVKYTPQSCYVITTQKLSDRKRAKIESEYFKILDAHKTISDAKILSLMRLYSAKQDMILVSSDSDFAKEANRYIKNNRLHWIVAESSKKRVIMYAKLDSANLTISSISVKRDKGDFKKSISTAKRSFFKKKLSLKHKIKIENHYGLKTYLHYWFGKAKALFLKIIHSINALFKQQQTDVRNTQHEQSETVKCSRARKRSKKSKHNMAEKFGLQKSNSRVSYRYIFRLNQKRKMSICGKVQYNSDGMILLMLHQNLKKKYKMPSFEKVIRIFDKRQLNEYIKYEEQRDIYLLNDFKRVAVTTTDKHRSKEGEENV